MADALGTVSLTRRFVMDEGMRVDFNDRRQDTNQKRQSATESAVQEPNS